MIGHDFGTGVSRQLSGLLSMSGEILVEAEPVKREQAETYI